MARREELQEEQWALVEPLLPKPPSRADGRGRPRCEDRAVLNGILWILRSGARWQDLPARFPSYQTCHRRFQHWVRDGTLVRVLQALADDLQARGGLDLSECFIDGTFIAAKKGGAPLIVTTNVQFFESLFAARTSRCRKLHNIADSVVVLDEAQLLSPEFLQPILDAMNALVRSYGVTFVLSTATQPALGTLRSFQRTLRGLDNVCEIVSDPDALYHDLERVTVTWPQDFHLARD